MLVSPIPAILSSRSAAQVVSWIRRVEETCGSLESSRAFLEEFEDCYHRMRDERVVTALARRIAQLEDVRFVTTALRGAIYRTGFSGPSVVARVDHAMDWLNSEASLATMERSQLLTFTMRHLMNAMLAEHHRGDGDGKEFEGVELVG